MTVLSTVTYEVKPGKFDQWLEMYCEAKQIIEGLAVNLTSIRAFRWAIAGPMTGRVGVVFEYGDVTDWGETIIREENDEAFNKMVERGMGADSPAKIVARGLHTEIVPGAGNGQDSVIQIATGRIRPGKRQGFLNQVEGANPKFIETGAERVRHFMVAVGGPNTGLNYAAIEYRDMAAFGESWHKRNSDPEWVKGVEQLRAPDGPYDPEGITLLTEIQA
ncbi:MAG: NIPSNAP family protein [Chloroflexota bacterium]